MSAFSANCGTNCNEMKSGVAPTRWSDHTSGICLSLAERRAQPRLNFFPKLPLDIADARLSHLPDVSMILTWSLARPCYRVKSGSPKAAIDGSP